MIIFLKFFFYFYFFFSLSPISFLNMASFTIFFSFHVFFFIYNSDIIVWKVDMKSNFIVFFVKIINSKIGLPICFFTSFQKEFLWNSVIVKVTRREVSILCFNLLAWFFSGPILLQFFRISETLFEMN